MAADPLWKGTHTARTEHLRSRTAQAPYEQCHRRENRYLYTGREWDEALSLYHYRARMYDTVSGRFLGRDPIGFEGSPWNLCEYVNGQPVIGVDPSGLATDDEPYRLCLATASQTYDNTVDNYRQRYRTLVTQLEIDTTTELANCESVGSSEVAIWFCKREVQLGSGITASAYITAYVANLANARLWLELEIIKCTRKFPCVTRGSNGGPQEHFP